MKVLVRFRKWYIELNWIQTMAFWFCYDWGSTVMIAQEEHSERNLIQCLIWWEWNILAKVTEKILDLGLFKNFSKIRQDVFSLFCRWTCITSFLQIEKWKISLDPDGNPNHPLIVPSNVSDRFWKFHQIPFCFLLMIWLIQRNREKQRWKYHFLRWQRYQCWWWWWWC